MIVNGNNFGNFKYFTPNNRLANKLVSENLKLFTILRGLNCGC